MSAPSNNHIKMKLDDGFQYAVIQFLQRPNPRIPPYVCIPHSWIRVRHSTVRTDSTTPVSIVTFPDDEDALVTERRILQNDKASERWKLYSAIVRYESNTFEDASKNMVMMAKSDIAQERSILNNDLHFAKTPSTSRSGPSLELNTRTNSQNSTYMNKIINMDAVNKERPMDEVSNPSKAAQITNVVPPILVKPLSSEIPKSVSGETETVIRRNSIQSLHNSRNSLQHGHNLQSPLTNHEIGIPRIDPNEPAIRVEHGSQRIVDNQLHASPSPLILKQLLLDNVDPESFSREYESLLQRIKNVHNKQSSIAVQKQDSNMRPVASIVIDNPVDASVQPRMVINTLPGNQNVSRHMHTELPQINSNKPAFGLINVASSYSANQLDVAVESLMESEGNNFQEYNIETVASKDSVVQENNAFDSMLNIWINDAADLFQTMHNNVTQTRVVTNNFEKALEKTDGQFEYFANLFDNLRKLTKRNTNEDTSETQKPPNVDKENLVNDCDMKENTTESTKSANLSDNDYSGSDEWENNEDEDDDQDDQGDKVRGRKHSFTLPPEYKRDDTKWTLKYQESDPKRGIVELIPGRNVYIDAIRLGHCKRESQDHKKLARKLLEEIFSQSALSVCSYTGKKANAFCLNDKDVRPGLDENARVVILEFVENYGREKGWGLFDPQSVKSSQRSRLQEIRYTHKRGKIAN